MPKSLFSPEHKTLVSTLISARKSQGLTQTDLATRLNKDQRWISIIETEQRRIDVLEFYAIATAIGLEPTELFAELARQLPKRIDI